MNNKLNFVWIDDEPRRSKSSNNIETQLGVNARFIKAKNEDIQHVLSELYSKAMPDLILVDHKLQNMKSDFIKTGSTIAEAIRAKWPECPIVCITGISLTDETFDIHQRSVYEDVFQFSKISNYYSAFLTIAQSYKLLRKHPPKDVDGIIKLIKPAEDDEKRLKDILPEILKKREAFSDNSLLMAISNWVRHTLIAKPGFLYDRLWSATLLGLKEQSFNKVEDLFKDAKYDGIFHDEGNERWWQTKIREIIFSKFPDSDMIYPWELGQQLPDITEKDFSKCYVSREDFPETVAFTDETAKNRKPMRLRYTVPHPHFEKSLYFEEMRMMKGAE